MEGEEGIEKGGDTLPPPPAPPTGVRRRDCRITDDLMRQHGYSDNCSRCTARRNKRLAAGLSHTATCRRRLEDLIQKDEQMAEVLRRRDVRHGLVPPDVNDPAVAQDIDDPEPVFIDRSDRPQTGL